MARAEYDFSAASEEEISMRAGDMLNLAPKGESSIMTDMCKLWFTCNRCDIYFQNWHIAASPLKIITHF